MYVRIMQALGAYGFRGFYERKPVFLQSVPYALKNVRWLLQNVELLLALPTLMDAFRNMGDVREIAEPDRAGFARRPTSRRCLTGEEKFHAAYF